MPLSMADAAYQILKEHGKPQHYMDIINEAIKRNLIRTQGLTPGASLLSIISQENSKRISRGDTPRFDPMGNGVYGITDWRPIGIEQRIREINQSTREELRKRLSVMPAKAFEELIGELLIAVGFDEETVEVRGRSGDGGIDVIGVMDIEGITRVEAAVQVKKVQANISPDKITALRGSLLPNQKGIFITTSNFTKQAVREANATGKAPVSLVNIELLLDLLFQHKIGVHTHEHIVYEIDSNYWPDPPSTTPQLESENNSSVVHDFTVQYPLKIFAQHKGHLIEAELLNTGEVIVGDQRYTSVSAAGTGVTGWKSCNGWHFWSFINPTDQSALSISVLRKR